MKVLLAMAVGYVIGSQAGGADLDRLARALRNLYGTAEFTEVVSAARCQIAGSLRDLASVVEGGRDVPDEDLLARVRSLMDPD
jgi:hypothetical protein